MEYIITPIWILFDLLTLIIFSRPFFTFRNRCSIRILAFICVWGIVSICACLLPDGYAHRCVSLLCSLLLLLVWYKGSFIRFLLCIATGVIFIGIVDTLFLYGTCALLGISYSVLAWKKLLYISSASLSKLIALFLAYLFKRHRHDRIIGGTQDKWLLLTLLFPISSLLMMLIIFTAFQNSEDLSTAAFLYGCILAVANIAILYLLNIMEKRTKEEQQLILLNQQISIQRKNIAALEQSYRNQRSVTHEYMHQLDTIVCLLDQNEDSDIKQYIASIQSTQRTKLFHINTHNPIMDAVLNQKYQWASEHNIKMQFQINDLSQINIGLDELVVLFSNLFDNAIEACLKLSDNRTIDCTIIHDESLFISIRNTSPFVPIVDGRIESTKTPKFEHGFGLPNICRILTQFNAEFAYHYEDGWFHFVAEIPTLQSK